MAHQINSSHSLVPVADNEIPFYVAVTHRLGDRELSICRLFPVVHPSSKRGALTNNWNNRPLWTHERLSVVNNRRKQRVMGT